MPLEKGKVSILAVSETEIATGTSHTMNTARCYPTPSETWYVSSCGIGLLETNRPVYLEIQLTQKGMSSNPAVGVAFVGIRKRPGNRVLFVPPLKVEYPLGIKFFIVGCENTDSIDYHIRGVKVAK